MPIPRMLWDLPPDGACGGRSVIRLPAEGLQELRVDVQTLGNLVLCFDAGRSAEIVMEGDAHLLPARVERIGDILHVEGRNLGAYFDRGQRSKVLIELHLPAPVRVRVGFVAGAVILNGGSGDVDIRGNFGEVTGITHAGSVRVKLRCGDVSLRELAGTADIDVALGNVSLGWSRLRGTERVRARTGLGAVDLVLPPGVAPLEERGGFCREKRLVTPQGTDIDAKVGFGGLDVLAR